MKFLKGISLFFFLPCIIFLTGMYTGVVCNRYFYPGSVEEPPKERRAETVRLPDAPVILVDSVEAAADEEEVLNADTEYVIEEYDVKRETLVETVWKVPAKYLGMNREEFTESMGLYAMAPPLAEQQRGFVGLEVRSFSSERVVVRMNYSYAEPTKSFYLRVEDNQIVVYCDDGETVYLYTDISALNLPEYMQTQIIGGMFVEDEAALYQFLETYSS